LASSKIDAIVDRVDLYSSTLAIVIIGNLN